MRRFLRERWLELSLGGEIAALVAVVLYETAALWRQLHP